jgi:hypothetical protein
VKEKRNEVKGLGRQYSPDKTSAAVKKLCSGQNIDMAAGGGISLYRLSDLRKTLAKTAHPLFTAEGLTARSETGTITAAKRFAAETAGSTLGLTGRISVRGPPLAIRPRPLLRTTLRTRLRVLRPVIRTRPTRRRRLTRCIRLLRLLPSIKLTDQHIDLSFQKTYLLLHTLEHPLNVLSPRSNLSAPFKPTTISHVVSFLLSQIHSFYTFFFPTAF